MFDCRLPGLALWRDAGRYRWFFRRYFVGIAACSSEVLRSPASALEGDDIDHAPMADEPYCAEPRRLDDFDAPADIGHRQLIQIHRRTVLAAGGMPSIRINGGRCLAPGRLAS